MKRYGKLAAIGLALTGVIVLLVLLLPGRRQPQGSHLSFVPAGADAVITLNWPVLKNWMKPDSLPVHDPDWMSQLEGLSDDQSLLLSLVGHLLGSPGEMDVDAGTPGAAFLAGNSPSMKYLVVGMGVKGTKGLGKVLQKSKVQKTFSDKSKGYHRIGASGELVAWNDAGIILMIRLPGSVADLRKEFDKLAMLPKEQQFFLVNSHASAMLAGETGVMCWVSHHALDVSGIIPPELVAAISDGNELAGYLSALSFGDGEIQLDMKVVSEDPHFTARERSPKHPFSQSHFIYHRNQHMIASLSASPDVSDLAARLKKTPGVIGATIAEFLSIHDSNAGLESLLKIFGDDLMISVTHPDVKLGQAISRIISDPSFDEDPFALLAPAITVTITIHPDTFRALLPQLIKTRLLIPEGGHYRLGRQLTFLPGKSSRHATLYVKQIGEVLLISNQSAFVQSMTSAGVDASQRIPLLRQHEMSASRYRLDLHVDNLYRLMGDAVQPDGAWGLISEVEYVHMEGDSSGIRLGISLYRKSPNSLVILLERVLADLFHPENRMRNE